MKITSDVRVAVRRLAEALDYGVENRGRKMRLLPPEYLMDDFEAAGLGHAPTIPRAPLELLGHLIVSLNGQPNFLSYGDIWELCRFDGVITARGGWWIAEVNRMMKEAAIMV